MNGELITHFESFPNSTTTLYDEHLSRSFCHGYPLRSLHPNNQIQNFLPLSITEKLILEQRHKISKQSQTQNMPKNLHKKARSLSSVAAAAMALGDEHERARRPPARLRKSG
jgi:hypothetical protein